MSTTPISLTRAIIEALGELFAELGGYRSTRLRFQHPAGATSLGVESSYGMSGTGKILIEGEDNVVRTYSSIDTNPGLQRILGISPPLNISHRENSEVVDITRNWSALDQLRRALLVDYAVGKDLDRLGRGHGVNRPRGFSDTVYRGLIKAKAYMAKTPIYAIEQVLEAIYGAGSGCGADPWTIYESLVEKPGEVFISIPGALGTSEEGRTLMNSRETVTSATALTATATSSPARVRSLTLAVVDDADPLTARPSLSTPAWTYVPEGVGAEALYFNIVGGRLVHGLPAPGINCGRYQLDLPEIGPDHCRIGASWQIGAHPTINAAPWKLGFEDGEREVYLMWNDADLWLGHSDGTTVAGPYAMASLASLTTWHNFILERKGAEVTVWRNGARLATVAASLFNTSSNRNYSFGYFATGLAQDWDCTWADLHWYSKDQFNYWNLYGVDGALALGSDLLSSAAAPFIVTDPGRMVWIPSSNNENYGPWRVLAAPAANQLQLDGVTRQGAYTSALTPNRVYSVYPWFRPQDVGKTLVFPSGALAGSYLVTAAVSAYECVVGAAFAQSLTGIPWKYSPAFVNEVGIAYELLDAGDVSGANLTLRGALPAANTDVEVNYMQQESAQIVRYEIQESGTRRPFFLGGINHRIRKEVDDVTAAGVIPRYNRTW